jgi:hypothetical protein
MTSFKHKLKGTGCLQSTFTEAPRRTDSSHCPHPPRSVKWMSVSIIQVSPGPGQCRAGAPAAWPIRVDHVGPCGCPHGQPRLAIVLQQGAVQVLQGDVVGRRNMGLPRPTYPGPCVTNCNNILVGSMSAKHADAGVLLACEAGTCCCFMILTVRTASAKRTTAGGVG